MMLIDREPARLPAMFSSCMCSDQNPAEPLGAPMHRWCVRFMAASEALADPELLGAWSTLMHGSANPERLAQSPSWLSAVAADSGDSEYHVAVIEGDDGIAGVVPLRHHPMPLRARIGGVALMETTVAVVSLLGSRPLMPDEAEAHQSLYTAISRRFPGCGLHFRNLPSQSSFAVHLNAFAQQRWLVHSVDGEQPHHLLRLPRSFEEFLSRRSSRTRSTLRRKLRAFDKTTEGGGNVELVDRPEQVRSFLEVAATISRRSWQHRRLGTRIHADAKEHARLSALATQGVFRGYVLYQQTEPCAFVMGYQYDGTFHLDELGYAEEFSALSPGTVLFLHVVKDLIEEGTTSVMNFGDGDAEYKRSFSTERYVEAALLVLPRTLRNRIRVGVHRLIRQAREMLKRAAAGVSPWSRGSNGRVRRPSYMHFLYKLVSITSFKKYMPTAKIPIVSTRQATRQTRRPCRFQNSSTTSMTGSGRAPSNFFPTNHSG